MIFRVSIKRHVLLSEAKDLFLRFFAPRAQNDGFAVMFIFCFLFIGYFPSLFAAEPMMKTLSAHVVKVAEDGSSIDVDFHHPATKEVHRLTFFTDNQTGLSGIGKLRELRAGQVVSIDYVEGAKGRFFIRRIARVKLSGPPSGLEKFRGF